MELLSDIKSESIDLFLFDPPYGTTRSRGDNRLCLSSMWAHIKRIRKPGAPIVATSVQPFTTTLNASNLKEFRYELVWEKTAATGHLNCRRRPLAAHENISVFYDLLGTYNPQKTTGHPRKTTGSKTVRKPGLYGGEGPRSHYDSTERFPRSVQVFPKDKRNEILHPFQKPVALLRWLIRTYSNPGDHVLDFCSGSGSTGVAALWEGRDCTLIENDREYDQIARERISAVQAIVEGLEAADASDKVRKRATKVSKATKKKPKASKAKKKKASKKKASKKDSG